MPSAEESTQLFDFDHPPERRGTHSIKWDYGERFFGRADILPMWVADMDFASPPAVCRAMEERARHGVFGYTGESRAYFEGFMEWMRARHGWSIEKEWVLHLPGLLPGLNWVVQTFSQPGEEVMVQPPIYPPFFSAIRQNGRSVVENPLVLEGDGYRMDLEGLEKAISSRTRMLLFCSPHNPVGRVWNREELEALGDLCCRKGLVLISDEIHADLTVPGAVHRPLASLSERLAACTVTLLSPAKTFNLQGLQSGFAVASSPLLRERLAHTLQRNGIFMNNLMSIAAIEAAYREGADWLDALRAYLASNRRFLHSYAERKWQGKIKPIPAEGTYLAWLDCRSLGLEQNQLKRFFIEEAGLGLNNGTDFGSQGKGFMRMNLGCSCQTLQRALDQLQSALHAHQLL